MVKRSCGISCDVTSCLGVLPDVRKQQQCRIAVRVSVRFQLNITNSCRLEYWDTTGLTVDLHEQIILISCMCPLSLLFY